MDATKIRLRFGAVEIDYEGSEGFLKENFPALLAELANVAGRAPVQVSREVGANGGGLALGAATAFDFSTNTIASVTGAKTGPDLAMSAAAHLTLTKGAEKFSRKELLTEMQSATTFYNQSYSGNLSKILNGLTKAKRLNLVGNHTYALTRGEREAFTSKLSAEA
jgi:hypothetical protein